MKKNLLLFSFYFIALPLIVTSLHAQEKGEIHSYARKIVDTMASESMHGRGYVNGGDKIAANYIRTEFQRFGLKSFTEDYYQKFNFSVNTFPDEVIFLNRKNYNEGVPLPASEFLVNSDCPPIKGEFKVVRIDSSMLKNKEDLNNIVSKKYKNVFVLTDTLGIKNKEHKKLFESLLLSTPKGVKGFAIVRKRAGLNVSSFGPWSVSQTIAKLPRIQVLEPKLKKIQISVESKLIPDYQSQNVIAYVQGSGHPDSFIVFSAHYDHLGRMGKDVYFPGANDNASGCAMLLNLARHYSKPENKPNCSIAFIAFGAEEAGLLGSKYYTEHPFFPLKNIKFLLNMDIMGTGEEGIMVVNGSVFKSEFDVLKKINTDNNYIKDVKIRGRAANSDHYFFSEKGVKAFFIYTMGGIKAYHDIYDRPETLPLNEFEDLFRMILSFSTYLQN